MTDAHSSPDPKQRSPSRADPPASRGRTQLDDFASGIAHDFNNMLTVILGSVECAERMLPSDSPIRGELAAAHEASVRGAMLVRLLGDGGAREAVELRLSDLLRETSDLLQRVAGPSVTMHIAHGPAAWLVRANAAELWQVVLNLVSNARDAMPGGGDLYLGTQNRQLAAPTATERHVLPPGDYIVLIVRDTGIGIDAATRARMFEPHFTTKGKEGTGIGLTTVGRIVGSLGGGIRVDSAPGRGATFEVLLPRANAAIA